MELAFTKQFGDASRYVVEGDHIECRVPSCDLLFIARIIRDDDTTPPDERQDGFWPSLDSVADDYAHILEPAE